MDLAIAHEFVQEVNSRIDGAEMLRRIGYAADKIQVVGDAIKAFCPIHKDKKFRSLLIETDKQSFKCTLKTCTGAAGGSLVELYALARKVEPLMAAAELVGALDIKIDTEWTSRIAMAMLDEAQHAFIQRDLEQAEITARQALKFQPDLAEARLLLANMHAERGDTAQAVDEYAALVEAYLSSWQYTDADSALESAVSLFPDSEDLLFLQVRSAELQDRQDRAVELLKQIVERREKMNRHVDNLGVLQKLAELRPADSTTFVRLGDIFERRHDMRTAGRWLEKAAELLKQQGRNAEAIPLLEKVVQLAPEMAKMRMDLAEELIRDGEFVRAKDQIFEIANQQIENQDYVAASKTVRRWLDIEPESADVHETLARIHMDQQLLIEAGAELEQAANLALKQGETERALQLFFRVKFVAPDNLKVRRQIIDLFEQQGETERAGFELLDLAEVLFGQQNETEAEAALVRAAGVSDSTSVKQQVADALLSHGRKDAAADLLEQLLRAAEQESNARAVAAACKTLLQLRPDDLMLAYRRCISLWTTEPDLALGETTAVLGRLLEKGNREEAVELLQRTAEQVEDFSDEALACLNAAVAAGDEKSAGKLYSVVIAGLAEHEPETALEIGRAIAVLVPDHPSALSDCGVLLANLGMAQEAADIYCQLAKRAEQKGDPESALQHAEDALSQIPEHLDGLRIRAKAVLSIHGAQEAQAYFQAELDVLRAQGRTDNLLGGFACYLELYPEDLRTRFELGSLQASSGDQEAALHTLLQVGEDASSDDMQELRVQSLDAAAALAPDDPTIWARLADAQKTTDPVRAAEQLTRAAELYLDRSELEQAHAAAAQACELQPGSAELLELECRIDQQAGNTDSLKANLPRLIVRLRADGRLARALEFANQLLQLAPNDLDARLLRAELFAEDGDTEQALREYQDLTLEYERLQDYPSALAIHAEMAQLTAPDVPALYRLVDLADKAGPEAAASARLQLGQALLASGQVLEAFAVARDLGQQASGGLAAAMLLKRIGQAAGAHDEALAAYLAAAEAFSRMPDKTADKLECLEGALVLDPENAAAHKGLAEHYEAAGEPDFAFSHRVALLPRTSKGSAASWKTELSNLRKLAGDNAGKHLELGRRVLRSERVAEAMQDLETAAQLAEQQKDTHCVLEAAAAADDLVFNSAALCRAKFEALSNDGERAEAIEWLKQCAQHALRAEKPDEAEEYARKWVELERAEPDALELLASAYYRQNRTQKAVETYIALANLLKFAGESERAIAILRQTLSIDGESIPARQLLWQVLLEAERQSEALVEMQQLADLLIERRSYREASTLLSRILDYRTNSEDTLERLASLVHEHEGFAKASPYFRKLLQLKSTTLAADQLAAEYEKILRLEGADLDIRIEYAEFLEQQGLLPDAKQQYVDIAQTYRDELNESLQAIEYFGKAVELLPENDDARIYEEIAKLHRQTDNSYLSVVALRRASALYAQAGEAKRSLQAIRSALEIEIDGDRTADEALQVLALHAGGEKKKTKIAFDVVLSKATAPDSELDAETRRQVFEALLQVQPLNLECMIGLLKALPEPEVAERALAFTQSFEGDDQQRQKELQILAAARDAAPLDAAIASAVAEAYGEQGDSTRMLEELAGLATLQIESKKYEEANATLTKIANLKPGSSMMMRVAGLFEKLENNEQAVSSYCAAAEFLIEEGKEEEASSALRMAVQLEANAVPAAAMATLARKGGSDIRKTCRNALEAALIARTRTRSLVLATALLEREPAEEANRLLSMVFMRAGAGFLTAIVGAYADWLLDRGDTEHVTAVTLFMTELAPNSPDVWWLASQLKKRYGDKAGSAEAALHAARLYNEAGAVSEEESCYREVLEEIPEDEPTLQTLAFFYEREKRGEEGVPVMARLASIAEARQDYSTAISWLRKAVELGPAHLQEREHFAVVLASAGKTELALEQWMELGKRSAKAGESARAERAYEQVLAAQPEDEQAASYLLEAAKRVGDEAKSRRLMLLLAEIKAESGALTQACQLLKNILQTDTGNEEALEKLSAFSLLAHDREGHRAAASALANILAKQGKYLAAIEQFESVLESEPHNMDVLQSLIDCCAAEGLNEKGSQFALRMLRAAREEGDPARLRQAAVTILEYDPEQTFARRELADALLCMNRIPDAVAEWSRAAEQLQSVKDIEGAVDCYRQIVQVSPAHLQAWQKLGDLSLASGDPDSARAAYLHLLDAYASAGEGEKLDALVTRMLLLDPDDAELHREAFEAFRRGSRNEKAMEQLLWLVRNSLAAGNTSDAEQLIELGMQIAPESAALQHCELEVIRKLGRTEELQLRLRQLADKYLAAGELEAAADVLSQMKAADPANLELARELGMLYMQTDEVPRAIPEFGGVLRELLSRQETEEARTFADQTLSMYSDILELRAHLAEVFAQNGMADIGARHYAACADQAAEHGDASAQVHFLGLAVAARPHWIEGYQKLTSAALEAGDHARAFDAMATLADLQIESRKYAEAVATLQQQIHISPEATEPRTCLVDIYERTGDRANEALALHDLSEHYVRRGMLDEAIDACKRVTILQPENPDALQRYIELFAQVGNEAEVIDDYVRLAQAYAARGDRERAAQVFEQAAVIDRRNTDVREKFAAFLLGQGENPRALSEMRKISHMYCKKGDPDSAVEILHAALALNPRNAEVCLSLAAAQLQAGLAEESQTSYTRAATLLSETAVVKARQVYQRLITEDPENPELHKRLCDLLVDAGETADAVKEAETLARIHLDRGDLGEAEAAYLLAEELGPSSASALRTKLINGGDDALAQYLQYVRLGYRLFQDGEVDAALDAFRSARSLSDERPQLIQRCIDCIALIAPEAEAIPDYIAMAERLTKTGDYDAAISAYEHVARLDPMNADARIGLRAAMQARTAPKTRAEADTRQDRQILGRRERRKRVAMEELLSACKEAAVSGHTNS